MIFENNASACLNINAKVPYITFPALSDISFVIHGFSTRLGGVSKDIFSSMNLASGSLPYKDDFSNVLENFERITASIGIDPHSIVMSDQVHKTNIRLVDESDLGKGLYHSRDYKEIDGLITDKPGITLVTKYADCVPLFFVDLKKKAIGLTHSGWRGTVQKIGLHTVLKMQEAFNSSPEDMIAVIGPSICHDCYEVGEEVAKEFIHSFSNADLDKIIVSNSNGSYQCNLWEANKAVLTEAGLKPVNIHLSGVCTSCHSDLLFSHRKTGGKRGSLAAFLAIKNS